jgi:hypothetical protein
MKSGARANESGRQAENSVGVILESLGISHVRQWRHYDVCYGRYNVYDFVCWDLDVTIESKNQVVGGSVDEKWAFNLFKFFTGKTPTKKFVMIFQGNEPRVGYREFLMNNIKSFVSQFANEKALDKMKDFHIFFTLDDLSSFLMNEKRAFTSS